MGLLIEIRKFVKRFVKSPVMSMAVAYLIYKILSKKMKEGVNMEENIRVLHKDNGFEIIFDTTSNSYAVIDGRGVHNDIYPAKNLPHAKKIIQQVKSKKYSYRGEEKMSKLNTLYEKIVLKETNVDAIVNNATKMKKVVKYLYYKRWADPGEITPDMLNDEDVAASLVRQAKKLGLRNI